MEFGPGDVLANYVTQTGDQVLVDKVTYNFRPPPRRGFYFQDVRHPGLANERGPDQEGSEDFIKRCVGLAGDLIEVKPPVLLCQRQAGRRSRPSFAKEFAQTDRYPGYSLVDIGRRQRRDQHRRDRHHDPFDPFDKNNSQTYYVPADCYWAMGDNSPNSKDSRYWGGVPRRIWWAAATSSSGRSPSAGAG